ncbi:MAG: hypothetical protein H6708_32165 [Kofleriaceae bacterium]|nr:hypothetical protein [Myxococcales bacterium]MCB9565064.1 hypothetical protein [Kofleriaceae bacterium]
MRSKAAAGLVGAVAVAVVTAAPTRARADSTSLHVLGDLETGWTDNIFSAPSDTTVGAPAREGDAYAQLRPGLLFTWERPRMIQQLEAAIEGTGYASHTEAWTLSYHGAWRAFFLVSPRSEASTTATASAGTLNTFTTTTTADNGQVAVLPSATNDFTSVDVAEHFSYQVTRPLRVTQSLTGRLFDTSDDTLMTSTAGREVGGSLGLDRAWRYDAVGLNVATSYVSLSRVNMGVADETSTDQMNAQLTLSWRRDLSRRWTSVVDGGVTSIVPLDAADEVVVQPTVGVQLGYFPNWGNAGLQLRRSVAPNLYIAQNTITDQAGVNAWLPLPWLADDPNLPKLSAQGTAGFARTRLIDAVTGTAVSSFDVATADAAVNYLMNPSAVFTLRYQFIVQNGDETALTQVFDYTRHSIILSFHGRWPSRLAAEMPVRATLRVDRSNVTSVGDEAAGGAATAGQRER